MASQVDDLLHPGGYPGIRTLRNDQGAVLRTLNGIKTGEFVCITAALETETFEKVKGCALRNDGGGKTAAFPDQPAGIIVLIYRNGDPVGIRCDLDHCIGDASVVFFTCPGRDDK